MSLRRKLTRRSLWDWAMRLALAAVAAALGYCSVTFSLAQVVVDNDPVLAYRLAPYDGRITAAYATSLAGEQASSEDRALADHLAKLALRQDPTAIAAAATLGVNADIRGDTSAAQRYFTYAQKLSRRDLRTQLWMIEDAVRRGDVPAALHQYDLTLRVFPSLGQMLYPVLASASGDPVIRSELVNTLAAKPLWSESFINFLAGNAPDPQSTATLFLRLRRAGVPVPEAARAGAVNALLAAGHPTAAWAYYTAIRPQADRRRSRDPRFSAALNVPSQLDWIAISDSGFAAGLQDGFFEFAAPASEGGAMLQQVQLLPPGEYRLLGHSVGIEQAPGALPYWSLTCRGGRELGRVEVPNSSTSNGVFSGTFSVPQDCPVQTLVLMARPSDAISGVSGQIDRLELSPAGR